MKLTKTQKKVMLGAGLGLLGAGAIVTPIAISYSMSKANLWPTMVDQYDQEYGITVETYNGMKKQLVNKYQKKLNDDWDLTAEEKTAKMADMNATIAEFDSQFESSRRLVANGSSADAVNYNYSNLTSSLSDIAYNDYGIKLSRTSNITFDDLRQNYDSLESNMRNSMRKQGLNWDQINRNLNAARSEFATIEADLFERYSQDAYGAYESGIPQLNNCFARFDKEAAILAAQNKLNEFADTYVVEFKPQPTNSNDSWVGYNELDSIIKLDEKIDDDKMNKVFAVTNKQTGTHVNEFKMDEMLPNFRLQPILRDKFTDQNSIASGRKSNSSDKTNTYQLSLDWTALSTSYLVEHSAQLNGDNAALEEVTAHLRGKPKKEDVSEYESINDLYADCEIQTTPVTATATQSWEQEEIAVNYFGQATTDTEFVYPGKIVFFWSPAATDGSAKQNKYESFWEGIKKQPGNETVGILEEKAVRESGLRYQLFDKDNKDITSSVDKYGNFLPDGKSDTTEHYYNSVALGKTKYTGTKSLIQDFAENCEISAKVTLQNISKGQNTSGTHDVKVALRVCYKNTGYTGDGHYYIPDNFNEELGHTYTVTAQISEDFYRKMAISWNLAYDKFGYYIEGTERWRALAKSLEVTKSISIVTSLAVTVICLVRMAIAAFSAGVGGLKAIEFLEWALVFMMTIVLSVILGVQWGLTTTKVMDPLDDLCGKVDAAKKLTKTENGKTINLYDKLVTNGILKDKDLFIRWDGNHNWNKSDFQSQYQAFLSNSELQDFETVRSNYYEYYTQFLKQIDVKEFMDSAKSIGGSPENITKVLGDMNEASDDIWVASTVLWGLYNGICDGLWLYTCYMHSKDPTKFVVCDKMSPLSRLLWGFIMGAVGVVTTFITKSYDDAAGKVDGKVTTYTIQEGWEHPEDYLVQEEI